MQHSEIASDNALPELPSIKNSCLNDDETDDDQLGPLVNIQNSPLEEIPIEEQSEDQNGYVAPLPVSRKSSARGSFIGRKSVENSSRGRRESLGTQKIISDFMSAAGVDNSINNISTIARRKMDVVAPNFVPQHVRNFCEFTVLSEDDFDYNLKQRCVESFAAVVMVDVSGYSKLSAALAEKGPIGSELLSKSMKGYLDKIIQTILKHEGDIVKFAGDAVICYWRLADDKTLETDKGEVVLKASKCCLDLLTSFGTYEIDIKDCSTKLLRIHLGIGAGEIYEVHVGGPPGRWEFFIAGDGVNQLGSVLDLAKAGELALSHQALKCFSTVIDIDTVNIGNYDKRCIILTGLEKAKRKKPEVVITKQTPKNMDSNQSIHYHSLLKQFIDQTALFKIQADLRQSQLFGMDTDVLELLNLIELRQISTLFIKIGDLQRATGDTILEESQKAIQIVQSALYDNEGTLRQFHVDDKGAVILCFFGLPPFAHENDAALGIKAAIEIKQGFLDIFEEFSIGITTGVVAFGGVGYYGRTEYAVMGDSINMAARLMCHPEAAENLLCDEKTFNLCSNEIEFKPLGETKVKGKPNPISIFRPISFLKEPIKKLEKKDSIISNNIIGRQAEKTAIKNLYAKHDQKDLAGVLILEADGGQGISSLTEFAKAEALVRGFNLCGGSGSEVEKLTPYYVFRIILGDLFELIERSKLSADGKLKLPLVGGLVRKATLEQAPWDEPPPSEEIKEYSTLERSPSTNSTRKSSQIVKKMSATLRRVRGSSAGSDKSKISLTSLDPSVPSKFSTLVEVPSHAPIRKKTIDSELGLEEEVEKVNHADILRQEKGQMNSEFYVRAKKALEKCGAITTGASASVLNLVMPSIFGEDETNAVLTRKMRLKELAELIKTLVNVLTEENKVVILIKEAQHMDSSSWELLNEVISLCPKLGWLIFTRRIINYDNESNKLILQKLKSLPKSTHILMEGMNREETKQMILESWKGPKVKQVAANIIDDIKRLSDGKPLFIKSLAIALKESGQWRILNDGILSTEGQLDLGLSFDDRNLVLSQFDRLERTFQLFLKVASVLGQRFYLEDVLYFLTGMPGMFSKIQGGLNTLVSGVEEMDKYDFLQKSIDEDDKIIFDFKSSVVRHFIISLMVLQQRQAFHIQVARFIEGKYKAENKLSYLIPIYEHYMESGDKAIPKKMYYMEAVAQFHYSNESMNEAIKIFNELITHTESKANYDIAVVALWYRQLGNAYSYIGEYELAEKSLSQSLTLQEIAIPPIGLKFDWELKKQIGIRQKYDKSLSVGPYKNDYISSYPDFRGSNNGALDVKSKTIENFIKRMPPKLNGIQTLLALSELYMKTGQVKLVKLSIIMGLNACEEVPKDGAYVRLMALNALTTMLFDDNSTQAFKYIEIAESNDNRENISDSIQILKSSALISFLFGNWAESKRKFDGLVHLGKLSHDASAIHEALLIKSIIFFFGNSRNASTGLARELFSIGTESDDWYAQYWGSYMMVSNLLSLHGEDNEIDLKNIIELRNVIWDQAPVHFKNDKLYQLCEMSLKAAISTFGGTQLNPTSILVDFPDLLESLGSHQWIAFIGCLHVYNSLIISYNQDKLLVDANSKTLFGKICDSVHKQTKSVWVSIQLAADFKHLFKGLKNIPTKKLSDTYKAWGSGVACEGQTDAIYLVGLFNLSLGKFHEKKNDAANYLKKGKELFIKTGAQYEIEKVWRV